MGKTYWWIEERENPQTGTYYVACGKLTNAQAKDKEKSLYGYNTMHKFLTEEAYNLEIDKLRNAGERVQ